MPHALISLGSNLGDSRISLEQALQAISELPSVENLKTSRIYKTEPAGGPKGQSAFLNCATIAETSDSPENFLLKLHEIEKKLGRTRVEHWEARTIDLDLLLFDEMEIESEVLTLPHPRMSFRRFVLAPAAEIAPDMRHPKIDRTIQELLSHLDTADEYVALAGSIGVVSEEILNTHLGPVLPSPLGNLENPAALLAELSSVTGQHDEAAVQFVTAYAVSASKEDFISRSKKSDHKLPAISPFWLKECIPQLASLLSDEQGKDIEQRLEAFFEGSCDELLQPKLLIAIDANNEKLWGNVKSSKTAWSTIKEEQFFEIRNATREFLSRPTHIPTLYLSNATSDSVGIELNAAIEAMKPVELLSE